jgi:23S rRNA (guanosine2251-2'-O)-methyltransferase
MSRRLDFWSYPATKDLAESTTEKINIFLMLVSLLMRNKKQKVKDIVVVLDNIRSVHNVGAIFRTADALGVDKIFLCGITPAPIDRFGRERNDLHKAALGAEKTVSWDHHSSTLLCVEQLKREGYSVVCVEQAKNSIDYKTVIPKNKTVFVFGNELGGISKDVLNYADYVAEIEMIGSKESLNVSVAFGVVMFRILDI